MAKSFWIAGGSATGAAILLGMGLGHFVTTPQKPPPIADLETMDSPQDSPVSFVPATPEKGPETIRCTGCGPTLAERQMMADQGGWDPDGMIHGSTDPVAQDYMTPDAASSAPPPVERFAAGEEPSPAAIPDSAPVKVRPTLPPAAGQP